uniref:Uncharacterized protein n=1 Tax=viral metagenome TaxID=1070528 RepID=A0A6C0JBX4_9ZZZZ|tara:strand:- start:1437 stop:2213 length:777 start_codon:yes stop_codon:yes gene_type:complete
MGDFFKDVAGGAEKAQAGFLGPTYNYAKQILPPSELGMSGDGNMGALARDITGLINYTEVLTTGKSRAQRKADTPLGNKFYLKTGGQCKSADGMLHDRWLYVNNVPTGSLPFITSATGNALGEFRGLVPGTIENLGHLNPLALFGGFMQGTNPACRVLDLPVTDKSEGGIKYVADADIVSLSPCLFGKGKVRTNPVSGSKLSGCASGFQNINDIMNGLKNTFEDNETLQYNPLAKVYNVGFSALLIYLMYHLVMKSGD